MESEEKSKVVAAAIILRDGRHGKEVLIAKRHPDQYFSGYWEFIGGKMDDKKDGGDPRECMKREVKEEAGVEVEILEEFSPRVHDYGRDSIGKVELHFFLCRITEGHAGPQAGIHDAFAWIELRNLGQYQHLAGGHSIIQELVSRLAS